MPTPLIANGFFGSGISGHLGGNFTSIATQTLGSNAATISFSSIPQTYTHLQLRFTGQYNANDNAALITFNGDTTTSYSWHSLSSVTGYALASQTAIQVFYNYDGTSGANYYNSAYKMGGYIDILDYTNTNKYKTTRSLSGVDYNGGGRMQLDSGSWQKTSAITSISLTITTTHNFVSGSTIALYGVK
jgi:hypothetical protein